MNRRTVFSNLIPSKTSPTVSTQVVDAPAAAERPFAADAGINPYSGKWEFAEAAHLLRRAMFAPTTKQIKDAVDTGLNNTLNKLFTNLPLPAPPLNNGADNEPSVAFGETWVNAIYRKDENGNNNRGQRIDSFRGWTTDVLVNEGVSIREKMTLFWHNHFPTADLYHPNLTYRYITLLRQNALGNFRELTKKITIDPSMLAYLNGMKNSAVSPNENYARELLELFTIGKGALVGAGDYTNYTEADVAAAARILTGWRVSNYENTEDFPLEVFFENSEHDSGNKQFSHRFNNQVINNNGANEYKDLIDMIFGQAETARFICREFYKWFIYYDINEATETNIIEPLANDLIASDYNVASTLRKLLNSEHFFAVDNVGCMIKNPCDFFMSIIKPFETQFPTDPAEHQYIARLLVEFTGFLQMLYYEPPSVAGWKAYYQEPLYYRAWINSVTLVRRLFYSDLLLGLKTSPIAGFVLTIDALKSIDLVFATHFNNIAGSANPYNVTEFINEYGKLLLPKPLGAQQIQYFKEILIPGLPDFEWTQEFDNYQQNSGNEMVRNAMNNKLQQFLQAMFNLPEFQLM